MMPPMQMDQIRVAQHLLEHFIIPMQPIRQPDTKTAGPSACGLTCGFEASQTMRITAKTLTLSDQGANHGTDTAAIVRRKMQNPNVHSTLTPLFDAICA